MRDFQIQVQIRPNETCCSVNLEEEVDNLRVQTSQDAATIHELKTCLEQEREGKKSVGFNYCLKNLGLLFYTRICCKNGISGL